MRFRRPRQDDVDRYLRSAGIAPPPMPQPEAVKKPQPVDTLSKNPLRPTKLDDMIGQDRLRGLLRRVIDVAKTKQRPLDHVLLVGPSGMGKTTVATVIANELGSLTYQVEAPVSHETLLALRDVMCDRDVLFIDEIHQQAIAERRGKSTSTQPEVLFNVMEDQTIVSGSGILDFPAITIIGGTTDEGMLPDAFVNRFPIRPHFDPYTIDELRQIAFWNGYALDITVSDAAEEIFAYACRGVPRHINNFVKNAAMLTTDDVIGDDLAWEVVHDFNGTTADGLSRDMQNTLLFLYEKCKRVNRHDEIVYQASVNSIATAIGKSRDSKAVSLRVEPYLIEQGLLQVGHGGRRLTPNGIIRAAALQRGQ